MYFNTDTGVFALFKILRLTEDVNCDRVLGDRVGVVHHRLAANVTQELRKSARLPERARGQQDLEFIPDLGDGWLWNWEGRTQRIQVYCLNLRYATHCTLFRIKTRGVSATVIVCSRSYIALNSARICLRRV